MTGGLAPKTKHENETVSQVTARWKLAGTAFIVLLTIVVYLPAMRGGFVFDDHLLIADNRLLKAGDGLHRFWFTTEASDYYPLTYSALWLEWRLFGDTATGYHVVNVLLHIVNTLLVWIILRRLTIPGAWFAALVFAVHPVNVATVAWISEQKNTLSMVFYLLAILLYLRFDEERRPRWYCLSLGAFLLALFSKTAVAMLPFVLLGCVWWRHGRLQRKDVLRSVPFFVASLVLGLVTIWFQHYRAMEGHVIRNDGFIARLTTAGWAPWFYLSKAILPLGLTTIYPKHEIDPSGLAAYLPGLILIGCFILFWRNHKTWGRPLLFGLGYFVVTLFPVLGFFDQGFYQYSLVADHWLYCSIVGVIALAVAAGVWLERWLGGRARYWGTAFAAVLLVVLAMSSWKRGFVYANDETLWTDNLKRNPDSWAAHYSLGLALYQVGKPQEAVQHFREVVRIKPNYLNTYNDLGRAYLKVGLGEDAIACFQQAMRMKPDYFDARSNLGKTLLDMGKFQDAITSYQQALQVKPDSVDIRNNLGIAFIRAGRVEEAIAQWERVLQVKPDDVAAHNNLGIALRTVGRIQDAIGHCEQALRIKPDYVEAHYNLGLALAQQGNLQEAMKHWEQALLIRPDYAEAHADLGLALEQTGRTREAIGHYEQALRFKPDYLRVQNNLAWLLATLKPGDGGDPNRAVTLAERVSALTGHRAAPYLDTLAAAYAAAGRFPDAIATAERAIELARKDGQPQVASEIEAHLNLYRSGQPYHQATSK